MNPSVVHSHDDATCMFGTKENALSFRRDGYGIRVLSKALAVTVLSQSLIPTVVVDTSFCEESEHEVFNRIHCAFLTQQYSVVVVHTKDNARISDALFRWCAEFTRCNPWTYIIFNSLDLTCLATENLNRWVRSY